MSETVSVGNLRKCETCGKSFVNEYYLEKHVARRHGEDDGRAALETFAANQRAFREEVQAALAALAAGLSEARAGDEEEGVASLRRELAGLQAAHRHHMEEVVTRLDSLQGQLHRGLTEVFERRVDSGEMASGRGDSLRANTHGPLHGGHGESARGRHRPDSAQASRTASAHSDTDPALRALPAQLNAFLAYAHRRFLATQTLPGLIEPPAPVSPEAVEAALGAPAGAVRAQLAASLVHAPQGAVVHSATGVVKPKAARKTNTGGA